MKNSQVLLLFAIIIIIGVSAIFWSKRDEQVLVPPVVEQIPSQPSPETTSNMKHFVDSGHTFTFDYNPAFETTAENKISSTDWSLDVKEKGVLLASTTVPRTYMPNTNFSSVRLTVGRSSTPNAIKNCLVVNENNPGVTADSKIDTYPFKKSTFNDAGLGNIYETTSYRGIVDGDCYAIEYTVHSTNIANYSPDQGIKEFDKSKIESELSKIIASFKFTVNSN